MLHVKFHIECKMLRHVVTPAAETDPAGFFYNCQTAIDLQNMLRALGHPQQKTAVKTDNSTAASFVNKLIKQKRSKSWDVRYHWLTEKQEDNTFNIYWGRGVNNYADYHSKHHGPKYHKNVRQNYILKGYNFTLLKNLLKNTKLGHNTAARFCSNPTVRRLRTNVPAECQRPKVTVNNINKRERIALLP